MITATELHGPTSPPARRMRVGLVAMPFAMWHRPSIQLGLLTSLAQPWADVQQFHLFVDFAQAIGVEVYDSIGGMFRQDLYGSKLQPRDK